MDSAISIKNLTVKYGAAEAVSDVNLEVKRGEYLGIIGPNGGGKTTLLKAILGLIKPASGSVTVLNGGNRIGYVPQIALMDRRFPLTVTEAVLSGKLGGKLKPFFRYSATDRADAKDIIAKVGLAEKADNQIGALSGGEFQKMLIARALAVKPELLLLDEPTANVDSSSREQIYRLLSSLNGEITIVLVTHDLLAVSSEVKSLACLNRTLVYHGAPELNQSVVQSLYGCPVDLIAHGVPHRVMKEHGEDDCC